MKIELQYKEPGTCLLAYTYNAVYDVKEIKEAVEELQAARNAGYEITIWRLVHDENVTL